MTILVALDLSDSTDKVIIVAKKMAKMMKCHLFLLHVAEPNPDFVGYDVGPETVRDQVAAEFHQQHKAIQHFSQELRDCGIDCKAILAQGPTVETVLNQAKKISAEFIIIGSHGHGAVYDILVGSISAGIIKKSSIPVTLVPVKD